MTEAPIITDNHAMEDDLEPVSAPMKKRWMLTINNPIFADSGYEDVDISDTDLEIVENYYDLSYMDEEYNKDLIEYKYIKKQFDGKEKIIKRPFFKNLDCLESYFKNLREFSNLKYAIYQYEKSESGTYHIQGFIIYKNSKRFKNVKQDFPTSRIKEPNGSNIQNRDYCTKKDSRVAGPWEIGEFSEMRSRNDIVQFFEAMQLGASNILLKSMFPVLYSQYKPDTIEKFRQDELKEEYGQRFRSVKVTYIYGAARLGKTTYIYDKYPMKDICRVNNYTRGAFESYTNQKVLVLDEFTGQLNITFMNNLLDKFPVDLPARFTNRTACFSEVYIISNLPLTKLYQDDQLHVPEVYNAFRERIHEIIKFTALGKFHYEKRLLATQGTIELEPLDEDIPF